MAIDPSSKRLAAARGLVSDKRRHHRHEFVRWIQVMELDSGLHKRSTAVLTNDISAGGISFRIKGMHHVGTRFGVLLMREDGVPLLRVCQVTQCRYEQRFSLHVVGARWLPTPAALPIQIHKTAGGYALSLLSQAAQKAASNT